MSKQPTPKDPQFEARVRDSFAKQTFMATLGARLARVGPGEVTIDLPVREALSQQHGSVHAGAVASVLDSAAGYAALSLMPEGAAVLSVEFKLNLLEPAVGVRIEARAHVVRSGRTLTACTAEAWAIDAAGHERLVAILQGTMMCLQGGSRTG
ncbi:MAG: hotdog fold thioesterase [Planctomycetaceae bacterium]|nr:hotdog fold thioesterase [Planctomycetaceae bacterium]